MLSYNIYDFTTDNEPNNIYHTDVNLVRIDHPSTSHSKGIDV